jgi:polysaccharide export outer membrane protein
MSAQVHRLRRSPARYAIDTIALVGAVLGLSFMGWRAAAETPAAPARVASGGKPHVPLVQPSEWPLAGHYSDSPFGQGAYVHPGRIQHVPEYRLRVDDVLELVYRRTRDKTGQYRLNVGDRIRVELLSDEKLNRELTVQPDGTITLPLLGDVPAVGLDLTTLKEHLQERYKKYYKMPKDTDLLTVTPIQTDTKLVDVINTVDSRAGAGGQVRVARVTPDGSISLPAVGTVPAIGMTLEELKAELRSRYEQIDVQGIEVQPILQARAPRHVFVLGEVRAPGRYTLEGPTTVMQAISLAGGITTSAAANLRQVVILRRQEDWHMIATMIDLYDPIVRGAAKCAPVNDLWVADTDIVVVPKTRILVFDEFIELLFARGIYGVLPVQGVSVGFAKTSSL